MRYIISFLILIGGMAGVFGVIFLTEFVGDKIKTWEWGIDHKYDKYRYFKHNILPWIFAVSILCLFLASSTAVYLVILAHV